MEERAPERKIGIQDFEFIKSLNRGSYGDVLLVQLKRNKQLYALKVIDKQFLVKEGKMHTVQVEREVLSKLSHPNMIRLFWSFQDKARVYFVFEYCSGGEFSDFVLLDQNPEVLTFYIA